MKYSKLSILISISLFITACFDSGTSESEYFVAKSQISEKLLYQHLNASFKNSFESVNTFNDENLDYQILDIQTIYAIKDRCKETLNIEENDYEKDKSFSKRFSYKLKDNIKLDTKIFNECIDMDLKKLPLSQENLDILLKNKDYLEFKDNKSIRELLNKAKSDNFISIYEGLEIKDALYTERLKFEDNNYKKNIKSL
ncbi:hypothetical protein ACIN5162_0659 [Acinetobacter baumannii OIFC0162]|jgi:hypothetical protein|nr:MULTISPECIES: hypothetical protein [Acinetobacter calcoaceticus/baumannii complex]EKK04773.1 hypothetical protein ACIN5162_0659 [Acinetobacter baumannii OIFC0162]MCY0273728.1 hypothetical protein [Acinetobacter baumannii]MDC5583678.1 hypothetical protein [Acinetobacter baumannii]MDC5590711.1 hypothetical protein [Acinetobacter baumannii]MDO7410005.1 hypothetical protein [Acinetobacter baumannii]